MWIFERARDEGRLRSRLVAAMFHPVGTSDAERDELDETRARYDDDRLRVGPIKLYIDDVVEPWTAAMLEPYANRPGERGETFWRPDEFAELVIELERRGWSCHVHGTGDRGLRVALDGFEAARGRERRPRRPGTAWCTPSACTPTTCRASVRSASRRSCSPGTVRPRSSPTGGRTSARTGGVTRGRSARCATRAPRWPSRATGTSPRWTRWSASTRRLTRANLDGSDPWIPEETVDLETAIRAYTMGGAHVVFAEDRRGSISVGKQADLVVLSDDLFAAAERRSRRMLDVRVTHTVVDGSVVHRGEAP